MRNVKPLNHLTRNSRHEEHDLIPGAPNFLLGAGLQTAPSARPYVSRIPDVPAITIMLRFELTNPTVGLTAVFGSVRFRPSGARFRIDPVLQATDH